MRLVVGVLLLACACSSKPGPMPVKKPNTELIVAGFERRPPAGEQAIRFEGDGTYRIAKTKGELDKSPYLAAGRYTLEGDQLTLTATQGQCSESDGEKEGKYKVVLSKVGIRWEKLEDACESRARIDGQTWWRIKKQ
jgi:hypothetical protein